MAETDSITDAGATADGSRPIVGDQIYSLTVAIDSLKSELAHARWIGNAVFVAVLVVAGFVFAVQWGVGNLAGRFTEFEKRLADIHAIVLQDSASAASSTNSPIAGPVVVGSTIETPADVPGAAGDLGSEPLSAGSIMDP